MLDVLHDYVQGAATPELSISLEAAHEVFERIEFPNYETSFEQLLMMDDTVDPSVTLSSIIELTRALLFQILGEHGVVFQAEASIDFMTDMVNGLLDLPDYECQDVVQQTASLDGSTEEVFAELMVLVTDRTVDEILIEIVSVDVSLISRIKTLHEEDEALLDEVELTNKQARLAALVKFCEFARSTDFWIVRMLTDGMHVGYPFALYLNLLGHDLEALEDEQAAKELIAIAMASSDGFESPRATINQHIERYVSDVDKVTRIDIKISDLLLGMER